MSIERLKTVKDNLMSCIESQMYNLKEVDAKELGEVVDMVKDLEEAIYYCSVIKAMEDAEKEKEKYGSQQQMMMGNGSYFMEPRMYPGPMYYSGSGSSSGNGGNGGSSQSSGGSYSSRGGNSSGSNGGSSSYYSEREIMMPMDGREGRSPRSRRMYMEAKETHQDKAVQMRELEKYMQELASDVTEMIEDASPEEKQFLAKRISALATKLSQG